MLNFAELAPYDRVTFRGRRMNARDAAMHLEAEERAGFRVYITQGGFNPGGVGASGGTHDEGGALDTSTAGMSRKRKAKWLRACKDTGWCIWLRAFIQNLWPEHFHGVARGCKNLAPLAAAQVGAFDRKEDGLVGDGMDYSYRPDPVVEFNWRKFKNRWKRQRALTRRIGALTRTIKSTRHLLVAKIEDLRETRKRRMRISL